MSDIESDEDLEGNETENAAALSQQVESSKVDNDFSEPREMATETDNSKIVISPII